MRMGQILRPSGLPQQTLQNQPMMNGGLVEGDHGVNSPSSDAGKCYDEISPVINGVPGTFGSAN